ncbi:hypothetical protein [Chitinophaga sp.]|uniref:hypothetical protein n=1 Tax=Chitinophaga sp. TaxID=1869181 RepID=UPI0031DCF35E
MRTVIFILALMGAVSCASAQTAVKVVHAYYNDVYEKYNGDVVRILHLVKDSVSESALNHKYFSFRKTADGRKLVAAYQLYDDSRIISVTITGQVQDVVKLYRALYNRNFKKKRPLKGYVIKNDEWVRILADNETKEGKIIVQAIIY